MLNIQLCLKFCSIQDLNSFFSAYSTNYNLIPFSLHLSSPKSDFIWAELTRRKKGEIKWERKGRVLRSPEQVRAFSKARPQVKSKQNNKSTNFQSYINSIQIPPPSLQTKKGTELFDYIIFTIAGSMSVWGLKSEWTNKIQ